MTKTKDEQTRLSDKMLSEVDTEPIGLHGMSDSTVRVVIDQHTSKSLSQAYNISEVEDKGRYYIVKLVRPDGRVIDRLLIDKQSSTVRSLKG